MTLDQLARALRGMPRDAPMLVRSPEGLRPIVLVRSGWLRDDGSSGAAGGSATYSITLELGEPIGQPENG